MLLDQIVSHASLKIMGMNHLLGEGKKPLFWKCRNFTLQIIVNKYILKQSGLLLLCTLNQMAFIINKKKRSEFPHLLQWPCTH